MQKSYLTHSAEETKNVAREFAQTLRGGNILLLEGNLGSGKTTFTQGILDALGAEKPYTSPTFVILKTYETEHGTRNTERKTRTLIENPSSGDPRSAIRVVHHLDTYRITSTDLLGLGWEEMIHDKNSVILLEWPERVRDILPESTRTILFFHKEGNVREIVFQN